MATLPWKLATDGSIDECCCPSDCCLYPWPDPLGTPLYPDTDLPDTVVVTVYDDEEPFGPFDVTLTKVSGEYRYEGSASGYDLVLDAEGGPDAWLLTGVVDMSAHGGCLIGTYIDSNNPYEPTVEDEFADSYTMSQSGGDGKDTVVSRVSRCLWTGEDDCGATWYLYYGDHTPPGTGGNDYKWNAVSTWYNTGCATDYVNLLNNSKSGDQDSPAGTYPATSAGTITAS